MRKFGVCEKFAVPVEDITGLKVEEGNNGNSLRVRTEQTEYYTHDPEVAKRFVRSLSGSTNISSAYADDLIRRIDEKLEV